MNNTTEGFWMKKLVDGFWNGFDKYITAATVKVLKAFGFVFTPPTIARIVQFFRFGMAGGLNTIAHYVAYAFVITIGGHYSIANACGWILSCFSAYIWNSNYVFKVEEKSARNKLADLVRTYATYGFTGIIVNTVMLYVWIDCLQLNHYLGPILNLIITVPLNYIIGKFWTYKR